MDFILYPSDPLSKGLPDEVYVEEFEAARASGLSCSLFSFEDFETGGTFRARPALSPGDRVLYRGWMLTPEAYARLCASLAASGATPFTSAAQYHRCHHLSEWYPLCQDLTPETLFLPADVDFATLAGLLAAKDWPAYFVKDYVKSLTTERGSVARTPAEVAEIVALLREYRGEVEGGVAIRKLEDLRPETEERYFVLGGQPHGRDGRVPPIVEEVATRINSPFFSVDIVLSAQGEPRLVELGDGQVSDRKKWPADRFASMLNEALWTAEA